MDFPQTNFGEFVYPIHWHGLVDMGSLSDADLTPMLTRIWGGHQQVDVQRLWRTKSKMGNVLHLAAYSMKMRLSHDTGGNRRVPYDAESLATLADWGAGRSRGFRWYRFRMG